MSLMFHSPCYHIELTSLRLTHVMHNSDWTCQSALTLHGVDRHVLLLGHQNDISTFQTLIFCILAVRKIIISVFYVIAFLDSVSVVMRAFSF